MKYIKNIFNFLKKNKEVNGDILFKKVSYDDAIEWDLSHTRESVDKRDIEDLKKIKEIKNIVERISDYGVEMAWAQSMGIRFSYKYVYCTLTKFDDEWFLLHTISERDQWRPQGINRYYICDTMEGVIQALKNKNA